MASHGQSQHLSKRDIGLDILRATSAFAVVLYHAGSQYFTQSFPSIEWEARNVFMSVSHWAVPVFVMISGALFLNPLKNISLRHLYGRNLVHILCAYVVWSLVYGCYNLFLTGHSFSVGWLIGTVLSGTTHLWFLKMLVGLYVAIPVLRAVARDPRLERYFLIVALITTSIIPLCVDVAEHFHPIMGRLLNGFHHALDLNIATGFAGYFVLGHYLHSHRPSPGTRRWLLVLALLATVAMIGLTHWQAHRTGSASEYFYDVFNVLSLLQAAAVFVWATKPRKTPSAQWQRIISHASSVSFGIYLIHVLVIFVARYQFGIDRPTFTPWLFIPLHALGVAAVSYVASSLLKLLPKADRYIL